MSETAHNNKDYGARVRNAPASVSIVIPCYNPREFLIEAIASARRQTHPAEIILVNDGSTDPASLKILEAAAREVDQYIERPNGGPAAARNTAIEMARGCFIVPLDSDDILDPEYVEVCLAALRADADASYIYTNYRVTGTLTGIETLPAYNLYTLLDRNTIPYAALYRKCDWQRAGGYDVDVRGYEDWEFWLKLGARGRFGRHLSQPLFTYRKHSGSLYKDALAGHDNLVSLIRTKHPELYSHEGRAAVKARWIPATRIVTKSPVSPQTILDCTYDPDLPRQTAAGEAIVVATPNAAAHTAELAAIAVWGGRSRTVLPDGSIAWSPEALFGRTANRRAHVPTYRLPAATPLFLQTTLQHMRNANLLSTEEWLRHPIRSLLRMVPLRMKEAMNRTAARPVFDLTFYLQFETRSLVVNEKLLTPLEYLPRRSGKRRVAFITPHFGAGGAEKVALEMAGSLDRERYEILVIAAHSHDNSWKERWRTCSDHLYDLLHLCAADMIPGAMLSVLRNWALDVVVLQNTLTAYSIIPHLRHSLPQARIVDVVHSVGHVFDTPTVTRNVAEFLDVRVVISESARRHLRQLGVAEEKIRLIRNGLDLDHFSPARVRKAVPLRILFAGRLDPVKRPLLLPPIAAALRKRRPGMDFVLTVAGDGPERKRLEASIKRLRLGDVFDLRGQVEDVSQLLTDSDAVIIPSLHEGIPLIALEAMATARPVVASRVGAIDEAVIEGTGRLIEPGSQEVECFAEALDAILSDEQCRAQMGMKGRARVEAMYDRDQSLAAYRELIEP